MHRTPFALLLLAINLPMMAEDEVKVTVHQAEWGDTRGEAPPPSGPSVPGAAEAPAAPFQALTFRYGEGLRYQRNSQYGRSLRYLPNTRLRRDWSSTSSQYRLTRRYIGPGARLRGGYRPEITYSPGTRRGVRNRYGFSR